MNIIPFPAADHGPNPDGAAAILNGFTRLISDIQAQQKRLNAYGFAHELRNAMLLDLVTSSLRLFDANIKFLNEIKGNVPAEREPEAEAV